MLICPKCKTEYREGIEKCADCGSVLIELSEQPKKKKVTNNSFLKELGDLQFSVLTIIGDFIIAIGICMLTVVNSTWQETTVLILILIGVVMALFGKHLKEQRKILNLLTQYIDTVKKEE